MRFATKPAFKGGHPSDVPAGPRQTGDEAAAHGIGNEGENDGNGGGRVLGGLGRQRRRCNDDIDLEPHEFGCQRGQLLLLACRPAVLDHEVLSFDPAQFA